MLPKHNSSRRIDVDNFKRYPNTATMDNSSSSSLIIGTSTNTSPQTNHSNKRETQYVSPSPNAEDDFYSIKPMSEEEAAKYFILEEYSPPTPSVQTTESRQTAPSEQSTPSEQTTSSRLVHLLPQTYQINSLPENEFIERGFDLLRQSVRIEDGETKFVEFNPFTTISPELSSDDDDDDEASNMVEPEPFPKLTTETNTNVETRTVTETKIETTTPQTLSKTTITMQPRMEATTIQTSAALTATSSSNVGTAIRVSILLALLLLLV